MAVYDAARGLVEAAGIEVVEVDGADRNLSVVIERRKFATPDSEIEYTEATIP